MKPSLRWRLTLTLTALTTLAMLVFAIALFISTEKQEEDLIDDVITAALRQEAQRPTHPGLFDQLQNLSPRLLLYRSRDGRAPPVLPAAYAQSAPGTYEWTSGAIEYHVGIRQSGAERLYLLYDASEHEARLDHLFWSLVAGLIAIGLLALLIGHWLAGQMLQPLGELIARLHRDDGAILVEGLDREVELLARGLEHFRQRSRELLAREREFTANVSHELRTPLTRIRTNAELLSETPCLEDKELHRVERIVSAVDELEANLRSLLFLAREPEPAERRPVRLAPLVRQSIEALGSDFDTAHLRLQEDVPPDAVIDADATLLRLLLENLLRNALRHTAAGHIRVSYADDRLEVADSGIGIEPEHLQRVFERHYRAGRDTGGQGLGLAIVKHICDAHGWTCTIVSQARKDDPERGTRVSIAFDTSRPAARPPAG